MIFLAIGICNHWVSLLAHKFNGETEFFYFDSRNSDYLTWSEKEIEAGIKELAEKRIKEGKIPYTPFKIMIQQQSIRDTQRTLDLLVNSLIGNTSLLKYNNNRRFELLYTSIQSDVFGVLENFEGMDYEQIFSFKNESLAATLQTLDTWILCNYKLMKKFLKDYHNENDLNAENNGKFKRFLDFFRHFYKFWKFANKKELHKITEVGMLLVPLKISPLFDCCNL